jgi:hypothetical protein
LHRVIVEPGQVPLETDILKSNRYPMVALAKLSAAVFGSSTLANGLAVTATSPASMQVNVAPGEIYQLANLDATGYGSLSADTTHSILKQGISLDAVLLSCPAPSTAGQSINYLIQATFAEPDALSVVRTYFNASNPAVAWSGPGGNGNPDFTERQGLVTLSALAGVTATTGTQTTPAPTTGYVGLYVVTVAYGATTITSGNISVAAGAPILVETLLQKISQATADARYLQLAGGQMTGALNEAKATNIASASTVDLGAATGNLVHITGTTTITSLGSSLTPAGAMRTVIFDGALTLTYNSTSLILPGAANITTAAGDAAIFRYEGSGNWRCVSYMLGGALQVTAKQVQQDAFNFIGTFGGTTAAYTCTMSPVPSAYTDGLTVRGNVTATNATNPTLNANGLGAKNIYAADGTTQLLAGALTLHCSFRYSTAAGGSGGWVYIAPPSASGEPTAVGTSNSSMVTPAGLAGAKIPGALTDGASVPWNMNDNWNTSWTLTGNSHSLQVNSNPQLGQTYYLTVIQGGSGSYTVSWPGAFDWGTAGAPTLSTTVGKVDLVTLYCYDATTPKVRAVFSKG